MENCHDLKPQPRLQPFNPQNLPHGKSPLDHLLVTEELQTSQNTENHSRGASKWDVAEDVALISAWCITSENNIVGKNRKISNLWAQVKKMYDAAQAENPEKLSVINEAQMKGKHIVKDKVE
ncbi:hypothetical protein R6Q59_019664 [Mikania micrantha]